MRRLKRTVLYVMLSMLVFSSSTLTNAKTNSVEVKVLRVRNNKKNVKVKVKIANRSRKEITYGEYFELYKNCKGRWKKIDSKNGYGYSDEENVLLPNYSSNKTFYINKKSYKQKINKGRYKIKFKVSKTTKNIKFYLK